MKNKDYKTSTHNPGLNPGLCISTLDYVVRHLEKLAYIFQLSGNSQAELELQSLIERLNQEIDNIDAGYSALANELQEDEESEAMKYGK